MYIYIWKKGVAVKVNNSNFKDRNMRCDISDTWVVRRFYQTTSCDNASRNEQTSEPPASLPNKHRIIVSLPHPLSKKWEPPRKKTHTLPKTSGSPLKIGKLAPQKDRILFQPFMFRCKLSLTNLLLLFLPWRSFQSPQWLFSTDCWRKSRFREEQLASW